MSLSPQFLLSKVGYDTTSKRRENPVRRHVCGTRTQVSTDHVNLTHHSPRFPASRFYCGSSHFARWTSFWCPLGLLSCLSGISHFLQSYESLRGFPFTQVTTESRALPPERTRLSAPGRREYSLAPPGSKASWETRKILEWTHMGHKRGRYLPANSPVREAEPHQPAILTEICGFSLETQL